MKDTFKVREFETFEDFRIPIKKRLFDITFSLLAIIILSPFLLIIALIIKVDSKGPVIYRSRRVGTGYDIFNFYKFRTMYIGSDKKMSELSELNQYLINIHNKGKSKNSDICPE